MTLIELIVVVLIIVVLIIAGAVGLGVIRGANVDATASVIAGAMTYVSSRAVHDNATYRLVLDLDGRRYFVERSDSEDPCSRFMPEDAEPVEAVAAEMPKDGEEAETAPAPSFSEAKLDLLRGAFENDTNVSAVLTSHHLQSQTSGKVAIYFYPNGQAERALVWVGGKSSESETGWEPEVTVELHALGRITRHGRPVDERDFDLARPEEIN
jgi:type II secretory pathway pseudopilin PulG